MNFLTFICKIIIPFNSLCVAEQVIKPLTEAQVMEMIVAPDAFDDEVIGDGAWGKIIALSDGSLLKLIYCKDNRAHAQKKGDTEVSALKYFSALKSKKFRIPQLISSGHAKLNDNYCAWLQLTHVEGRVLSDEYFEELSPDQQLKLGRSLGAVLAELHNYACEHKATSNFDTSAAINQLQEIEVLIDSPNERKFYDLLMQAITHLPAEHRDLVVHGDIKFSNVIIDENMHVIGLIDFADTAMDFKELDFSKLSKHPHFLRAMVEAYNKFAIKPVNEKLLSLAEAINALVTAIIDVRVDDKAANQADLERFKTSWQNYLNFS